MKVMKRELQIVDTHTHTDPDAKLSGCFCKVPFNEFHIYRDGYVSNCCFSWLPTELGNVHSQTLLQMSENAISQRIKESVQNGRFNHCNSSFCPSLNQVLHDGSLTWPLEPKETFKKIHSTELHKHFRIYLSFDFSCNLTCESCRIEKVYFDRQNASPELLATYERVREQIQELLEKGYQLDLNITGSGDAFASPLYYELMSELPQTKNLNLSISTNGTMMTEKKLNLPTKNQIRTIFVSVDSCRPETYAKLRRGGKFEHVQSNLDSLNQMVKSNFFSNFYWQINFIVQNDNFQELGDFVDWSKRYDTLHSVAFSKILDWKHLSPAIFQEKAVWMKDHPNHQSFVERLQDRRLRDQRVILGNLSEYLRQ